MESMSISKNERNRGASGVGVGVGSCPYFDIGTSATSAMVPKDVNTVYSLPEIMIDTFNVKLLPEIWEYKVFFLTTCTQETFGTMVEGDFFLALHRSKSWKLYLGEVMFGYLKYIASTNESPWNGDYPPEMIDDLCKAGKIVVLKKSQPVQIPLTDVTTSTTSARGLKVTHLPVGLLSQMFEFEIRKVDGSLSTAMHIGTSVMEDIQNQGNYSASSGFPEEFKDVYAYALGSPAGDLCLNFATTLKLIRLKLFANPSLHFEMGILSSDRLVDIWYLKHLFDEFHFKTHVTPEYYKFIKTCIPAFADAFDANNANLQCRFHYDCCEFCSNEDCVPGFDWGIDVDVEELWIGYSRTRTPHIKINPGSLQMPFIHEI